MIAEVFLDANILVYAAMGTEERKQKRALSLIASENFGTSAQVLQEFFVTVSRKAKVPLTVREALEWIEQFAVFPCQPIDQRLVRVAIEVSERYRISYWDGAVLAAAEALGCGIVYSEDLNAGQKYDRVRVLNPFDAP